MRIGPGLSTADAQLATREVAARRTPATMNDVRAALSRALEAATGRRPNQRTVDVLAAQVSLETGHGGSMYNFNFGGIKGASPGGETATYLTREVLDGKSVTLKQGFRAYESIDEGARDYVAVLRARFPQAYAQAMAGNVDGFAHALKQSHYFTASEAEYTAGLRAAAGIAAGPASGAGAGVGTMAAPGGPLQALSGAPNGGLATSLELTRVLDAIAATSARIADPVADPESTSSATRG